MVAQVHISLCCFFWNQPLLIREIPQLELRNPHGNSSNYRNHLYNLDDYRTDNTLLFKFNLNWLALIFDMHDLVMSDRHTHITQMLPKKPQQLNLVTSTKRRGLTFLLSHRLKPFIIVASDLLYKLPTILNLHTI